MSQASTVFGIGTGRVLAGVVMTLGLLAVGLGVVSSGLGTLWSVGPWAAAIVVTVWALYWRPRIVVEDDSVLLVNILRTVRVPWSAVRSIDTRWTLTLVTDTGKFAAWASPGPGGMAKARALRRTDRDTRFGSAGPLGGWTDTAQARASVTEVVFERWDRSRSVGQGPPANQAVPAIRWHWPVIVIVPALIAVGIVAAVA